MKQFNLTITDLADTATPPSASVNVSTTEVDDIQTILKLAGVGKEESSCGCGTSEPSSTPVSVSATPAPMGTMAPMVKLPIYDDEEEVTDEGYANEPASATGDIDDDNMWKKFGLNRNNQELNPNGKDGADNRLGETVEAKYLKYKATRNSK